MKHVKGNKETFLDDSKSKIVSFTKKTPQFAKKGTRLALQAIRHPKKSIKDFNVYISDKPLAQAALGTATAAGTVGALRIFAPRLASSILGKVSSGLKHRRVHRRNLKRVKAGRTSSIIVTPEELDRMRVGAPMIKEITEKGMTPNEFIRFFF